MKVYQFPLKPSTSSKLLWAAQETWLRLHDGDRKSLRTFRSIAQGPILRALADATAKAELLDLTDEQCDAILKSNVFDIATAYWWEDQGAPKTKRLKHRICEHAYLLDTRAESEYKRLSNTVIAS